MNAPTTDTMVTPQLEMLPIARLIPSGTHIQELRRTRFDQKLIEDLAASIRQVGVLQPILARTLGDAGFEIVAGERRFLAAKKAGLKEIPGTVRELDDNQVLEVQRIENLQREGLHELEEAEGYEELMKLKKISVDAVADMVGKSRSYVFKRTKLLALCPEARKAFYAGELDASKALLIARIGHHDTQREALKDVTQGLVGWGNKRPGEPMTFKEAQQHIQEQFMLALKSAPFDINDATLVPKAGTCQACPKRTGNQTDLFGDVKSADVCTDPKCFDTKRQAHFAIAVRRLENSGKKVISGDAAKKVLPNWKETGAGDYRLNALAGGYVKLSDETFVSGRSRKVKDLLGPEYEPILIQHPGTGKVIEVATEQALAKAASKGGKTRAKSTAKAAKPKGPDVDQVLRARLNQLVHDKAPKEFGKAQLQVLVGRMLNLLNVRPEELADVAASWGWPAGAFKGGGYYGNAKLPKQALALGVRDLQLLAFQLLLNADRYNREHVLGVFGIDEAKTRKAIIDERKAQRTKE